MRRALRSIVIVLAASGPWAAVSACQSDDASNPPPCNSTMTADGSSDGSVDGTVHADAAMDSPAEAPPATEGGSGGDAHAEASGGGPTDTGAAEASNPASSPDTSTTSVAAVRLGNLSPGSPAIDFCLAPSGTNAYQGPLLAKTFGDAGSGGLPFPRMSAYVTLSAGLYDVRPVVSGAPDCSVGLPSKAGTLPALPANGYATMLVLGKAFPAAGEPGLQISGFVDSHASSSGSTISLRFVHAAPGLGPVDFGGGTTFTPFFSGVSFGATGSSSGDGGAAVINGYLSRSGLSMASLSARPTGGSASVASAQSVVATGGSVITFALVGTGASFSLFECVDNAGTISLLGDCTCYDSTGTASDCSM
jgi:hypothetical protein